MKFLIFFLMFTYVSATTYSISVCTTSSKSGANYCKQGIAKSSHLEVFILQDPKDKKFRTYLGKFNSHKQAKEVLAKSSTFIKEQQPFIAKLNLHVIENLKSTHAKTQTKKTTQEVIFSKSDKELISQIESFDTLIIEIDSSKNTMLLKANMDEKLVALKSYKVSTGKRNIKIPLGNGSVSAISLKPHWYPTQSTINSFKKKGINLPSVVPYGHKLNFMGAAKINLTHRVDGKDTYRIHGTLNEKSIGTHESAGCIRMKNNEVLHLAKLLSEFGKIKKYSNINVVIK